MEKLTPHVVAVSMLVVLLEFMLTGCNTWNQAALTKIPATRVSIGSPVTDDSPETQNGLNLPELPETDGRIWLETDPIQGWNIPWREWMWEEWIARHYGEWTQIYQDYWIGTQGYPDCPRRCEQTNDLPDRECVVECLVKHYYLMQGVVIYNIKTSIFEEKFGHEIGICEAEDCPAGYTLYIQVDDTDIDTMLELGCRNIVASCETIPPNIYIYGCTR